MPNWPTCLPDSGPWDTSVAGALKAVETQYFFGEADPNNKLENDDTLFQFLVKASAANQCFAETLSAEVYHLAAVMVPGRADHVSRKTITTKEIVNGKPHIKKERKTEVIKGNIRTYLPEILKALTAQQLNDTDMLMMALGTIRAETAGFRPIDEGISKYNTSPIGTKGHHAFDLYDAREDIGNVKAPDGALYKGRGFVQLTGHSNYTSIGSKISVDLEGHPDLANDPAVSAKILAQFLKNKETDIRAAVGANDLSKARRLVNGGSHGLSDFIAAFTAGRAYLKIVVPPKAKAAIKKKAKK
jgi:Chitinase class I